MIYPLYWAGRMTARAIGTWSGAMKFWMLTLGAGVFSFVLVLGAVAPKKQLPACDAGYARATPNAECSRSGLTCDTFKTREPTNSEYRYYQYCQYYDAMQREHIKQMASPPFPKW